MSEQAPEQATGPENRCPATSSGDDAVPTFRLPLSDDPMATLDRRVLDAWAEAEELGRDVGDQHAEQVVRARMYAMGLSIAAAAVGRPESVWASPERREAVRAWAKDRATLRDRLTGLAADLDADAASGMYAGGGYAREVLTDVARRMRALLEVPQ